MGIFSYIDIALYMFQKSNIKEHTDILNLIFSAYFCAYKSAYAEIN